MPEYYDDVEASVDRALAVLGNHIVMGAPLGLGKPNQLINAFYRRAVANPDIKLEILTALSLARPVARSEIEASFLNPFVERLFGDYPPLEYLQDIKSRKLPENVTVSEFYIKAGSMLGVFPVQANYISTNYTFAARDINARGVNLIVQMVASREVDGEQQLSLSSNTDITLDLNEMMQSRAGSDSPVLVIAQIHNELPFMVNRAQVTPDYFDHVIKNDDYNTRLFPAPNMPVSDVDYLLGFRASTLIKDGGTLQIGIGALGDAITYATLLRHQNNTVYRSMIDELLGSEHQSVRHLIDMAGGNEEFSNGLYGCSEMFVNGFLHLHRAGVLKRKVFDDIGLQSLINQQIITESVTKETLLSIRRADLIESPLTQKNVQWLVHWGLFHEDVKFNAGKLIIGQKSIEADLDANFDEIVEHALGSRLKHGIYMHGGFFLGPTDFYKSLQALSAEDRSGIGMDSVRRINRLDDVPLQSMQRKHARFINTGMMVTLSGAVVSDGLESGQVVSGVGGQYNFVAQAHELDDARSILCIRSTRGYGRKATSNIVAQYGHTTIPRHLRDIVITEYGIADLRAKTDEEIIIALLNIADSRFQPELLETALASGKLAPDYVIPEQYTNNTPQRVEGFIKKWRDREHFPMYPLGSDFSEEEKALAHTLRELKQLESEPAKMIRQTVRSLLNEVDEVEAGPYLERIGLSHPDTPKEKILQQLLLLELEENGYLKPL